MMTSQVNTMQESSDLPFIPESISSHDLAMSNANFSQVIFPDIPDFFPPESDISVPYILTEAIEPTSRDWIGLYRVGWTSPRDYSTYVWAPKPQKTSFSKARPQSVSFQAYQLPGDDKEFYQFCYVTRQGYVRGASTPFQFRHSTENDCLVETEDENGLIILRTKSDALEEQLAVIAQEKTVLEESIEQLTKEKLELNDKITSLESELQTKQENMQSSAETNLKLEAELEKLNKDLEANEKRIKEAEEQIISNKASLDAAEKTIENLKKLIEQLEEQKQSIVDAKANDDEKYLKDVTEKEVKLQEYEREKLTLLDQIKTLTLVKEEAQKQSATQQTTHEEANKAASKARNEIAAKLQCCKDERDLFKTQLSESELQRQDILQQLQNVTGKLGETENKRKAKEQEMKEKSEELQTINVTLTELEKKYKHEMDKNKEFLRNALERANGEKTAKQLLSKELSEATATRDKLMIDLTNIKKEKEKLLKSLTTKESLLGSLQPRLEEVEEELAISESMLLEHEKNVKAEKKRSKEVETAMKEKVVVLQRQLEEADHAVATATSHSQHSVMHKDRKTQTVDAKKVGDCDGEAASEETQAVVEDLKAQVTDLTTRLNMGADAYKEKFMECHKLERKLKKMKQLLQLKHTAPPAQTTASPAQSSASSTGRKPSSKEGGPEGWFETFEKFVTSLADPDAEEKEQAKQVEQKLEDLKKTVEVEQAKHRRYKQLYNEEKQKVKSLATREEDAKKASDRIECDVKLLEEENEMLKAQLKEFIERSDDVRLKQVMTYPPDDELRCGSSSQDTEEGRVDSFDENDYQLAKDVIVPSKIYHKSKKTASGQSTSSDASDEGSYSGRGAGFRKFNMCPDRNADTSGVHTFTTLKKEKVVSMQPIRRPPHIPDVITAQTGSTFVTSSSGDARKRKTQARRKSKKKTTA